MRTILYRVIYAAALAGFMAGCGGSGPAEVPKNPVPRAKPGATTTPAGAPGKAPAGQSPQSLPR